MLYIPISKNKKLRPEIYIIEEGEIKVNRSRVNVFFGEGWLRGFHGFNTDFHGFFGDADTRRLDGFPQIGFF
jgi:hypothetical protein